MIRRIFRSLQSLDVEDESGEMIITQVLRVFLFVYSSLPVLFLPSPSSPLFLLPNFELTPFSSSSSCCIESFLLSEGSPFLQGLQEEHEKETPDVFRKKQRLGCEDCKDISDCKAAFAVEQEEGLSVKRRRLRVLHPSFTL